MKTIGCIVLLILPVLGGCASSSGLRQAHQCTPTMDSSQTELSPATTTLKLVSISPTAGATLSVDTVLSADLEYTVQDFEPSRFKILAQFDTDRSGRTTDGTFKAYPVLKSAAGKVHFCFPMTHVWSRPEVTRPFVVRFYLNRELGEKGRSVVIARTQALAFAATQ